MVAPEHRHFAENAARMLQDGSSVEYVTASMRQLDFDTQQVAELLALAQQIAAQSRTAPAKRWWQVWK